MTGHDIAERFAKDTAAHAMTVLHDDGLYRHLHFQGPGGSAYWFDLITVPGSLIFRGDGDSFVFARTDDMFGFFRTSSWNGGINPTYWDEKLTSSREAAHCYDPDLFRTAVWGHVRENGQQYRGLAKAVQEHFFDGWSDWNVHYETEARAALEAFEYASADGERKPFRFEDTWEWSFTGHHRWFLWACTAIVRGIARYDAERAIAKPVTAELAGAVSR